MVTLLSALGGRARMASCSARVISLLSGVSGLPSVELARGVPGVVDFRREGVGRPELGPRDWRPGRGSPVGLAGVAMLGRPDECERCTLIS